MIERKKYLNLCLIGGMFGLHLFYAKKGTYGALLAILTVLGIYMFASGSGLLVVSVPAIICLVDAYQTYTQSDEEFASQISNL